MGHKSVEFSLPVFLGSFLLPLHYPYDCVPAHGDSPHGLGDIIFLIRQSLVLLSAVLVQVRAPGPVLVFYLEPGPIIFWHFGSYEPCYVPIV